MDVRKIKKLIDLVKENNISELEIHEDKESIHIVLNQNLHGSAPILPATGQILLQQNEVRVIEEPKKNDYSDKYTVKSPMVGTVYLSATPGAKSFVTVGQKVNAGDTMCLIEAMKMFNRIETDKAGTVVEILINNEQPVEYGQLLFVIE